MSTDTMVTITLADLFERPIWVWWEEVMRPNKAGELRPTKEPQAAAPGLTCKAESNNPDTWGVKAEAERRSGPLTATRGIGFMFTEIEIAGIDGKYGLAGVDLDMCTDADGNIAEWAIKVIQRFNNTYIERSPSETGIKLFFLYRPADAGRIRTMMGTKTGRKFERESIDGEKAQGIEVYISGRYFTTTFQALTDKPMRVVEYEDFEWLVKVMGPAFLGKPSKGKADKPEDRQEEERKHPADAGTLRMPLQVSFLALLVHDAAAGEVAPLLSQPGLLDEPFSTIAQHAVQFIDQYGKPPGMCIEDMLSPILDDPEHKQHVLIRRILDQVHADAQTLNPDFVRSQIATFGMKQAQRRHVHDMAQVLHQNGAVAEDVLQVNALMQQSVEISERFIRTGKLGPEAIEVIDAGTLTGPPNPRDWVFGKILCRKFLTLLTAHGAVGKTSVLINFLLAAATQRGDEIAKEYVHQHLRVLMLSFEDDREENHRRLWAGMKRFNVYPNELKGWFHFAALGPRHGKLASEHKGELQRGPLLQEIRRLIERFKPDIVSLDPLVKTHALPENDNNAMDFLMSLLAELAIEHDLAFILSHHERKGSASPGDHQSGRGAIATANAARTGFTLTKMSKDEAKAYGIPEDDRDDYIRMDSAQVNLIRRKATKWFRLDSVKLDNPTDYNPDGDEIGVATVWNAPEDCGMPMDVVMDSINNIDAGFKTADGKQQYYTDANSGRKDRAAWKVVEERFPGKAEEFYKKAVNDWVDGGALVRFDYKNPMTRKPVSGLRKKRETGEEAAGEEV